MFALAVVCKAVVRFWFCSAASVICAALLTHSLSFFNYFFASWEMLRQWSNAKVQ